MIEVKCNRGMPVVLVSEPPGTDRTESARIIKEVVQRICAENCQGGCLATRMSRQAISVEVAKRIQDAKDSIITS